MAVEHPETRNPNDRPNRVPVPQSVASITLLLRGDQKRLRSELERTQEILKELARAGVSLKEAEQAFQRFGEACNILNDRIIQAFFLPSSLFSNPNRHNPPFPTPQYKPPHPVKACSSCGYYVPGSLCNGSKPLCMAGQTPDHPFKITDCSAWESIPPQRPPTIASL